MSIDGIGKPGGASPAIPAPAAGPAGASGEAFKVGTSAPATASAGASSPHARLERGEIDLPQYLDARVQEATSHLDGRLTREQLDFVKESLREQLESDPLLVDLVQRATGATPSRG